MGQSGQVAAYQIPGSIFPLGDAVLANSYAYSAPAANTATTATLAATPGKYTWVSGLYVNAGYTSGSAPIVTCLVTGLLGGNFRFEVFNASLAGSVEFNPKWVFPIRSSGLNTAVTANVITTGATGGSMAVALFGFYQ